MKLKDNRILIEMQEAEHSTEFGIIVDSKSDKYADHGTVKQAAKCFDAEDTSRTYEIPAGAHILYSKGMVTPISDGQGVVEFKNVIGWEDPNE